MKISTKGRYGLRALIDICIYSENDIVTVKSISERQNISERYLEQIFASLRKGGIIKAKKGAQGGYFLTKDSKEFTIGDILSVLEGDLLLVDVEPEESDMENYLISNLWQIANEKMISFFNSMTLEDLAEGYRNKGKDDMYYI
ncbi:Rrf2 family transcriptional regulator [uncultured Clostridium sp.]|uniref:RrF2 family transcriptional regulator n=1 Tax=uncultured Clostridium sp. TaxID=59620 RepID=UPI0025D69943|nr:Rrf2 family transcriptional regulator [uncultured Clostridium sp.]